MMRYMGHFLNATTAREMKALFFEFYAIRTGAADLIGAESVNA